MKPGDKAFYIENRTVKEAEVIKIAGGFVTLRFKYPDPNSGPRKTIYKNSGIRLRQTKVYPTAEEAKKNL